MRHTAARFCFLAACIFPAWAQNVTNSLAEAAASVEQITLDAGACYRVRDVALDRGDLRLYFTDGWLIFAKPIAIGGSDRTLAAVYLRSSPTDDAELSVLPPTTGERLSLARFTGTPNLNEHLDAVLMLFTDNTGEELRGAIARSARPDPSPEQGLLQQQRYQSLVQGMAASFRLRLLESLLNRRGGDDGFFYAGMSGRRLGSFDALYDPAAPRNVFLGQQTARGGRGYYDVWTSFPARALRNRPAVAPQYTISANTIDTRLSPDLSMDVRAAATVSVSRDTDVLVFEISDRLTVSEVRVDGEPAELFQPKPNQEDRIYSMDTLQFLVRPGRTVTAGAPHQVEFVYSGRVITQMGQDVFTVGSRNSWYPTVGVQFSRFDMTFTYPDNLDLVFPGTIREQSAQDGQRRVRRVIEQPVRLAGFNVGHYESRDVSRGPLNVTVFGNRGVEARLQPPATPVMIQAPSAPIGRLGTGVRRPDVIVLPPPPPPDPLARLNALATEIASAFEYYAQSFGPPALPQLMVSPIPGAFGQGFPGLVYLSTLAYFNPNERPESARSEGSQLFFQETLHAHETAHQWWGNVVTTSTESDEWLMEALASYSSLMTLEKRKGPRALKDAFTQYRDHLLSPVENDAREDEEVVPGEQKSRESIGPLRLGSRLDNSLAPGAWQAVIYEKGAWVIHMLRKRMGDAAFVAFLKEFATKHRYQNVTTEQFFAEAAAHMPANVPDRRLEGFVESWVESIGVPKLELQTQLRGKAPNLRLTVTVKQSGVSDRFSTVVPVEVQLPGARPRTIWLETAPEAVSETITVAAKPARVTLDPDGAVLRR